MNVLNKRLTIMVLIIAFLLLIPLIAMQFTTEVNWGVFDFIIMGVVLFGIGLAYEFIARRSEKITYRAAFAVGLAGAFLLFWANGAVGIIGSENQPANLLYGLVFAVGLIGSLYSRFKPQGMALTLSVAAMVQFAIPIAVLIIWPHVSWGGTGMFGVFIFNAFFAMVFAVSALLFRQAAAS